MEVSNFDDLSLSSMIEIFNENVKPDGSGFDDPGRWFFTLSPKRHPNYEQNTVESAI